MNTIPYIEAINANVYTQGAQILRVLREISGTLGVLTQLVAALLALALVRWLVQVMEQLWEMIGRRRKPAAKRSVGDGAAG